MKLDSAATLGTNTGSVAATIDATGSDSEISYVNTSGTLLVNGVVTPGLGYSLEKFLGIPIFNDVKCDCGRLDIVLFIIPVGGEIGGSGTATTTPEPSVRFALPVVIVALAYYKRRNVQRCTTKN